MDEEGLLQRLRDYGADVNGTMERFLYDAELYSECLMQFLGDVNFDRLQNAIQQKDYQAAFVASHTLKGVAGNMGLTPLFTDICTLVEALRAGRYDELDAQYAAVYAERERAMTLLQ